MALVHRVFPGVLDQFLPQGLAQVDPGPVGEQQQIGQHVGALVGQGLAPGRVPGQRLDFGIALPLGQLQQFPGFQVEGNDQVAQAMELGPVALIPEGQHGPGQIFQILRHSH